ncbi:hypothetical protein A8H31_01790 [Burkholderia thailandensis]|nr:hypothetical protein A8H31_01790 [Burkholderia thailandensis]AWY66050.1 hypothetical protein A8H36_04070 [Burkholderia thailandensis]
MECGGKDASVASADASGGSASAGRGRASAWIRYVVFSGFINGRFKTFTGESESDCANLCVMFAGLHFSHSFRSVRWITVFEYLKFDGVESY